MKVLLITSLAALSSIASAFPPHTLPDHHDSTLIQPSSYQATPSNIVTGEPSCPSGYFYAEHNGDETCWPFSAQKSLDMRCAANEISVCKPNSQDCRCMPLPPPKNPPAFEDSDASDDFDDSDDVFDASDAAGMEAKVDGIWTVYRQEANDILSDLPACAEKCKAPAVKASGCDANDAKCLCTTGKKAFVKASKKCLVNESKCSLGQLLKIKQMAEKQCKVFAPTLAQRSEDAESEDAEVADEESEDEESEDEESEDEEPEDPESEDPEPEDETSMDIPTIEAYNRDGFQRIGKKCYHATPPPPNYHGFNEHSPLTLMEQKDKFRCPEDYLYSCIISLKQAPNCKCYPKYETTSKKFCNQKGYGTKMTLICTPFDKEGGRKKKKKAGNCCCVDSRANRRQDAVGKHGENV